MGSGAGSSKRRKGAGQGTGDEEKMKAQQGFGGLGRRQAKEEWPQRSQQNKRLQTREIKICPNEEIKGRQIKEQE